jgi:hypothetical protein
MNKKNGGTMITERKQCLRQKPRSVNFRKFFMPKGKDG